MNKYIYDIETYKYLFCVVFKNIETNELKIFEISHRKNEINKIITFLKGNIKELIGFNNINFDYPILHWLLKNYKKYITGIDITINTFIQANHIINEEFSAIYKNILIPQVDLFKIHHFDNKAKLTSLKALEIAMRDENIKDLPYNIEKQLNSSEIDEVISYCINDVNATHRFYNYSEKEIKLRQDLTKEYGFDLINANDAKMGEEILLHFLSQDMGISKHRLKKSRTHNDILKFKDFILPYIDFKTKNFKFLLSKLKNVETHETKDAFKHNVLYDNIIFNYGQGGLHGCIKPGIYKPKEDEIIIDLDVASFYPNLAIVNDFKPTHLGDSFGRVYKQIFTKRKEYPKSDARNYALKIALNGAYGKSNDEHSFLYDNSFTMKITLNGQLLLTMLIENIYEKINCKLLQANTDGFTLICKKKDEHIIQSLCKEWEKLTKLELESAYYSKMIIKDVNNYIAKYDNGKIKYKGLFEIDRAWHKNHSMLIVPKVLSEYYINNKSIEETLYNNNDIFDFTKRGRSNKDSILISRSIEGYNTIDKKLQKNNRYIISNKGVEIIKIMKCLDKDKLKQNKNQLNIFSLVEDVKVLKPREISLEAGYKCTLANVIKNNDIKNYDINYDYYKNEIKKITNIIDNQ